MGRGVGVGGCWERRGPAIVLGEEMLFNQTWLMGTSCQRACPLGPSTHAAWSPGQQSALSADTLHSDGHTACRMAGVGAGFASASPHGA